MLITSSGVMRGSKAINLKAIADAACALSAARGHSVQSVLVHDTDDPGVRAAAPLALVPGRDVLWADAVGPQPPTAAVEWMDAEAPLFLLYTSGSTGKPKGVVHSTGGYMVYAGTTSKYSFAMRPGDVFWCTADCGWIT